MTDDDRETAAHRGHGWSFVGDALKRPTGYQKLWENGANEREGDGCSHRGFIDGRGGPDGGWRRRNATTEIGARRIRVYGDGGAELAVGEVPWEARGAGGRVNRLQGATDNAVDSEVAAGLTGV